LNSEIAIRMLNQLGIRSWMLLIRHNQKLLSVDRLFISFDRVSVKIEFGFQTKVMGGS
jgi:hypothetical protein